MFFSILCRASSSLDLSYKTNDESLSQQKEVFSCFVKTVWWKICTLTSDSPCHTLIIFRSRCSLFNSFFNSSANLDNKIMKNIYLFYFPNNNVFILFFVLQNKYFVWYVYLSRWFCDEAPSTLSHRVSNSSNPSPTFFRVLLISAFNFRAAAMMMWFLNNRFFSY